MNEKFYSLPDEKQHRIINAGFRVFGNNSYKKSPVSEIAAEAGISKALLFYYFKDKKELYLFLWEMVIKIGKEYAEKRQHYLSETKNLFEVFRLSVKDKCRFMVQYPDMTAFVIRAYYDKNPDVSPAIHKSFNDITVTNSGYLLDNVDPELLIPGLDMKLLYQEMYWASDGCLRSAMQSDTIDIEKLESDIDRLIDLWQSVYLRKKDD